jgi:hypothetical protein
MTAAAKALRIASRPQRHPLVWSHRHCGCLAHRLLHGDTRLRHLFAIPLACILVPASFLLRLLRIVPRDFV